MRLLDDIIGKEILDSQANIIGKVKDIEIDTTSNKIESIIVTKGGFNNKIGSSSKEEKIPFEEVGRVGDKIILNETSDKIRNLLNL